MFSRTGGLHDVNVRVGHIIFISALMVAIGNAIQIISNHDPIHWHLIYVLPFIVLGGVALLIRHMKKSTIANIFMVLAWAGAYLGEEGNLTPAIFIIFALYIHISDTRLVLTLAGVLIVTVAKFAFAEYTVAQFFTYNSGYIFALGFYWYYIHPRGSGMFALDPHNAGSVDDVTLKVLHLMAEGKRVKEIADRVFLSREAVTKRLSRLRDEMGMSTNEQLIAYLVHIGMVTVTGWGKECPNGDNAAHNG